MDRARIVRAATVLSRRYGLEGWSLRQLTALLDTSPSVVFHHVGDRAALSEAVVSLLTSKFISPGRDVRWSEWVRLVASPLRRNLAPWPGVAEWLVTRGPVFPHMMPVLEDGMFVLRRDGFGNESALVYSTLYSAVVGAVAHSQARLDEDERRGHRAIGRQLAGAQDGEGVRKLQEAMSDYLGDPEAAEAARERAFTYLIERLVDGLEQQRVAMAYSRISTTHAHGEHVRSPDRLPDPGDSNNHR